MRHFAGTIAGAALAAACGVGGATVAAAQTYVSIGANPVGNTAYQWAAGLAEVINREVADVDATAEATKGYVANIRLLLDSELEAGFSNSKVAYEAYQGIGLYDGEEPGQILSWMSIAPIAMHVFTLADSSVQSLDDLAGKRVGMGQPGGTSMLDAEVLVEALGLTPGEDFEDFRVNLPQQVDMLANGQIDAAMWNGSVPLPPVIQLSATNEVRFLPIPDAVSASIIETYPSYYEFDVPAGTYEGLQEPLNTYGLGNVLLVRADVPEDLVYDMTKAIMENLDYLAGVHPALARVSQDSILQGFSAPLHPGALKYYREVGVPGIEEFVARTEG